MTVINSPASREIWRPFGFGLRGNALLLFLTTALIAVRTKRPRAIVPFAVISQGLVLFPVSISPIERYYYCVWMVIISVFVGVFLFAYINIYLAKRANGSAKKTRRTLTIILYVLIGLSTSIMLFSSYAGALSGRVILSHSHLSEAEGVVLVPRGWTFLGDALQTESTVYNVAQSLVIYYLSRPQEGFDPNPVPSLFDGIPADPEFRATDYPELFDGIPSAFRAKIGKADSMQEAYVVKVQTARLLAAEDRVQYSGWAGDWARILVRFGDF